MKKFKARKNSYGSNPIQTVEIQKETEKMVVLMNGQRELKKSSYEQYFDSWDEAKQFLVSKAESKLTYAISSLESAQKELERIKQLDQKVAD
jgi:hypothetical protein